MNRVLREDVVSDIDMPPFNKSAMDGYACRRDDIANELEVVEIIQGGLRTAKENRKEPMLKNYDRGDDAQRLIVLL